MNYVIRAFTHGQPVARTAAEIYRQASRSIAIIKNLDERGKHLCSASGIVLNVVGDVATNHHVVRHAARIIVVHENREYEAKKKYVDQVRDVCVLSVPGLHAQPVVMGRSTDVEIGSRVYAVGYPVSAGLTFSDGIVSSFRAALGGHYIQFTAPISAGSSGGGLFDEQGRLIGIPTYFVTDGQLLNFALPVEWVQELPKQCDCTSSGIMADSKIGTVAL